ncbi:uncharacterized protein LOC135847578 isoform X2 [Planococcus citri]
MTDHPDDTLLDDDVEEHDFNFDNEKEEALLADNEFDSFIEEHPKEESLHPNGASEIEHLDQEEDVLDIGIAEEDIVENELVSVPNTLDESVYFDSGNENIVDSDSITVAETGDEKVSEPEQISDVGNNEREGEMENDIPTVRSSAEDSLLDDEKHISSEKIEEISSKPTVISLRKQDKKSYDDLPDLAKVIELVQPHGTSRRRKHGKPLQPFVKKNRPPDFAKVNKHEDPNERNDRRSDYSYHRGGKDETRSNDESKRVYSFDGQSDTSMEIINQSQRVTEVRSSHNFVSEYKNFSTQSLIPRSDMRVERPIVTTVQITQERYQIAGDFQMIRPPMENSCQPLMRPFEQNRLFQPRGALPPSTSHQMPQPPGQFAGNHFPGVRPLMPPPNTDNYNRPILLPPRAPHPMPRRPLLPPSGPGLLPQPIRQRFPPHGGPPGQHNFVAPFMSPNGPPPAPAYHHNYQQNRSQFGLNSTPPFSQNFSRPPPFSQPPPSHNSATNGPYYSGNMPHMSNPNPADSNSIYQSRPPPPINPSGHFPRMPNDGSHSVMFQQSSQRVIRMPPLHSNVNENPQCVMNNSGGIGPPSSADYYVKESITTTSSAYLPPPVINQPPPPGVPACQSAATVPYGGDASHLGNNQVEYNRPSRDHYYADQFRDKYSHHPRDDYHFQNEKVSRDRDHDSQYLKRNSSSSINDDSSTKRYRYNYSNDKSNDDDEETEYRKKVEHQKKMREKFVQMKEEQRLKNQMQNFIQNNIKGVLQRREQLLRKNETDSNATTRFVNAKTKEDNYRSEEFTRNRNFSSVGNTGDKPCTKMSPPRKQFDVKKPLNNARNATYSGDETRASPPMTLRHQNNDAIKMKDVPERVKIDDEKNDVKNSTKQLHKVVKIKYKDGTVALKSFPVTGPTKRNTSSIDKSNAIDFLNVTVQEDDNNTNSTRRRMVISKQTSASGENNGASSRNENIIVESVRKGVTQSSVPLAQRFSNLKSTQKNETDQDSSMPVAVKSKNRLVISHEEKMRTVWIKNISPNTKTSLVQKIAATCGTIKRMSWIPGMGQYNEAKITFSTVDEAKKFIHNYHRKTIDTSLILVTSMLSDNK